MSEVQPLWGSAAWLAQAYDPLFDRLLFVAMRAEDYRLASFLDERSLAPEQERRMVPWVETEAAMPPDARQDTGFIFHIGHVGSTLISRLLGEVPTILGLREPMLLRSFLELWMTRGTPESLWAPERFDERLPMLRALLSRTFGPEQRALVKASSFVSEYGDRLLTPGANALLIYSEPQRYFETIFAGEQSRAEIQALASMRLRRLGRRVGPHPWRLWEMDEGERAGLAWACEMTSLASISEAWPDDVQWIEFDTFLARPDAILAGASAFLGHPLDDAAAAQIIAGPIMRRYSKGLEYEYDPQLRSDRLAFARANSSAEIRSAMRWLDQAASRFPAIAACLKRAGER